MNRNSQFAGGGNGTGNGGGLTVGDYANGMPNIRLSQIPASFMRQLPWMLPAVIVMIAASWWFTKDIKREYRAEGRILVQIGSEYVYDPASGNANTGINITADQITQTEADIIKNSATIDKVISQLIASPSSGGVGGERFAPKLYEKWVTASPTDKADRWNDIVKLVDRSYLVMPKPKSSIVNLQYTHEDGAVAVKALDTFMSAYLDFRNDIFVSELSGIIAEQREVTEEQLSSVERKIQSVLNKNGISEFVSERTGVQKRSETLRTELNTLRGKISAVEAALAVSEDQLRATPAMIDLQIDDRASQRLAQAELERRQLLAKYLPSSRPVHAKEAEISEIRAQISANGGKPAGGRRVGPNTVHQALMTQRNTYQAQADSFREQEITLTAQLAFTVAKVKRMRQINPAYQNLLREKATIEERLKGLNAKEQLALANKQQQDSKSDNIKIITRPSIPRKGRNMRKIMFALAALGSIFTVLMLALLRVFLDPKLYSPGTGQELQAFDNHTNYEQSTGYEYAQMGQQNVPEAVPGYAPVPVPTYDPYPAEPAYAPAAEYSAQGAYENTHAQPEQNYAPAQAYAAEPMPNPWQENPAVEFAHSPPAHAPLTATANPYFNTAPEELQNHPQEYAGPDGTLPVLGTAQYTPNPGTPYTGVATPGHNVG